MKKILSTLLALTMCLSLLSIGILASEEPAEPEEPAETAEAPESVEAEASAAPEQTAAEEAAGAASGAGESGTEEEAQTAAGDGSVWIQDANGIASAAKGDGSAWEDGVTLVVKARADGLLLDAAREANGIKRYAAYDIYLLKDGEAVPTDGSLLVRLAVPEGYDGGRCAIYRIENNGTLSALEAAYDSGAMGFDALSPALPAETSATSSDAVIRRPASPSDTVVDWTGRIGTFLVAEKSGSGDVNGDGAVNAKDVTVLFQYVNKQRDSLPNASAADVNGDGTVNAKDVTRLFQYANKQIASL